jgi:hypothetical protein
MAILDSHPDLCILPELHCWTGESLREQIETENRQFFVRMERAGMHTELPKIFAKANPRWRGDTIIERCDLIEYVVHYMPEVLASDTWGMKIMGDIRSASTFIMAWPYAKFLCMVRDPRDCYASQKEHGNMAKGGPEVSARGWLNTIETCRNSLVWKRGHGAFVHYEALVQYPDAILKSVCEMLGIDWSKRLLCHEEFEHILTRTDRVSHYSREQVKKPINTSSVGRWINDLDTHEICVIEEIAGEEMEAWDYEIVGASQIAISD